jgi:hypothetical protein
MIVVAAMPTFARQAKQGTEGQLPGDTVICTVGPGEEFTTIQSAVDDTECQTIEVGAGDYIESVTVDRDVTITRLSTDPADETVRVRALPSRPVFDIRPGVSVTLQDLQIVGGSGVPNGDGESQGGGIYNAGTLVLYGVSVNGNKAFIGGGIYNAGTLVLNDAEVYANKASDGGGIYNEDTLRLNAGSSVHDNVATHDGGGIYNDGALYLCGGTVSSNHLTTPTGPENNISGTPAQGCPPTSPGPGGPPEEGNRVLVDHKGKKELCLPEAALHGHLKHGDEIIDEEGCSDTDLASRRGSK